MKMTPKSCSCTQCRRGKASPAGKQLMRLQQRAYRHASNQVLRRLDPDYWIAEALPAPKGGYFD